MHLIKVMPIVPTRHVTLLRNSEFTAHMVLAQYAMDRGGKYFSFYRNASMRDNFIMLDNGAAEVTKLILTEDGPNVVDDPYGVIPEFSFTDVLDIANELNADEVVLPDHRGDRDRTVRESIRAAQLVRPEHRAVCPHGADWNEWCLCLTELSSVMDFSTVCIAKMYEYFPGGRSWARAFISEYFRGRAIHIHYLGFAEDPIKEMQGAMIYDRDLRPVRSIDSGCATAWAQHGEYLGDYGGHLSLDWDKPANEALLERNLNYLRGMQCTLTSRIKLQEKGRPSASDEATSSQP